MEHSFFNIFGLGVSIIALAYMGAVVDWEPRVLSSLWNNDKEFWTKIKNYYKPKIAKLINGKSDEESYKILRKTVRKRVLQEWIVIYTVAVFSPFWFYVIFGIFYVLTSPCRQFERNVMSGTADKLLERT